MHAASSELRRCETDSLDWHEAIRMLEAVAVPAALFWRERELGHVNAVAARSGLGVEDFQPLPPLARAPGPAGSCARCSAPVGRTSGGSARGWAVLFVPLRVGRLQLAMGLMAGCALRPTTARPSRDRAPIMSLLAPRYVRVAELVLQGRSDKEIAAELGLSYNTVRTYVRVVLRRGAAHSRAELIIQALRSEQPEAP